MKPKKTEYKYEKIKKERKKTKNIKSYIYCRLPQYAFTFKS